MLIFYSPCSQTCTRACHCICVWSRRGPRTCTWTRSAPPSSCTPRTGSSSSSPRCPRPRLTRRRLRRGWAQPRRSPESLALAEAGHTARWAGRSPPSSLPPCCSDSGGSNLWWSLERSEHDTITFSIWLKAFVVRNVECIVNESGQTYWMRLACWWGAPASS